MEEKVTFRRFFTLALAALLVGMFAASVSAEMKWKAQALFPPEDAGTSIQAAGIVEATNEALDGVLETRLYQAGQLVPPDQMHAALSRGVYDAAHIVPMMRNPVGLVGFGLPYGWKNVEEVIEFYYDFGFLDFMRQVDAKTNVYTAAPCPFGPVVLFTNFPVHKMEDLKGKKIWAEGPTAALVDALGGKPVWFDPGEVYMGLKLGTIDGIYFGPAELETMKLKEVIDYIILPAPISPLCLDWVINLKSWNKLTAEQKAEYDQVLRETMLDFYNQIQEKNQAGYEAAKAAGVEIIELDESEVKRFKEAAGEVWDQTAQETPQTAEAVRMLREFIKSKGR
jgi:TRAP-type C4-dicarboxylate transport system substrate-binding protein